jgi:hypothetical protein
LFLVIGGRHTGTGSVAGTLPGVGVAASAARRWLLVFGRFGFAARGVVHLLIGSLALAAAAGDRQGRLTDAAGALHAVARERFGRPVLGLLALGLLAYASLRLVQGLFDPETRPRRWRTALLRTGEALTGAAHLLLAVGAARLFWGLGGPVSSDARSRAWTSQALAFPFGPELLTATAVVLAIIAVWFAVRALILRNVCKDLRMDQLGPAGCRAAAVLIRTASGVQALLFATVSYLVYRAASTHDAAAVRGTGGALRLLSADGGRPLLVLLACGLVAVGLSSFVEARWRRLG